MHKESYFTFFPHSLSFFVSSLLIHNFYHDIILIIFFIYDEPGTGDKAVTM